MHCTAGTHSITSCSRNQHLDVASPSGAAPRPAQRVSRQTQRAVGHWSCTSISVGGGALSRREALQICALLPGAQLLWAAPPARAEAAEQQQQLAAAPEAAAPPQMVLFQGGEFELQVPAGFRELEDTPDPNKVSRPRSTLDGEGPENPLRARFISEDGQQIITVLSRQASRVKPTFMQLNDITQYGGLKEVADLLLPKGTTVLAATQALVKLPARDTGTIRGVVEPPPEAIYRYDVRLANGLRGEVAIAAVKGRVYVMAASVPEGQWEAAAPSLRASAASFKLTPSFSPVVY